MADTIMVKMEGLEELQTKLRRMGDRAEAAVREAENSTGASVRTRAIRSISRGPATGTIYPPIEGRRGKPHQASAPGQPPMRDTGKLENSIEWERDGDGVLVGTSLPYGKYLELKPKERGGREWLGPAVKAELPNFRKRLIAAIRRLSNGR